MAGADYTTLLFPTEILEKIILDAWSSPLTTDVRINFMTSSLLVNKTWKSLLVRISFQDVHILSPSYLLVYLRTLAGYSSMFGEESESLRTLCHSITVKIRNAQASAASIAGGKRLPEPEMASGLFILLADIHRHGLDLPNLRTLCVRYENMGFHHTLAWCMLLDCPRQITNLEFSFSFDRRLARVGDAVRTTDERFQDQRAIGQHQHCLSGIRNLNFAGASRSFVADMVECCQNVESATWA